MSNKISVISLGCPKNQVDAEIMTAKLKNANFEIVDDPGYADIIIINTCGFIESAKKESIENILDMVSYKEDYPDKKVLVTGCLAQRYQGEVQEQIPEVDGVIGIGANDNIVDICNQLLNNESPKTFPDKTLLCFDGDRELSTPSYTAYLKIAEGCSNNCTYCAIPMIRGPFRSRSPESILEEAQKLVSNGVKEITLVAQDTSRYGEDLYGKSALVPLLKSLCKIEDLKWIRLLYLYPERIDDALIETIATEDKILKYMDIPVQHCCADVLKRMNRKGDREYLTNLIKKIRSRIADVTIRSTLIAGFPGETEEQFNELCEFVEEVKFERMGCFAYSEEEGTPAVKLDGMLLQEEREKRADIINDIQGQILDDLNDSLIGKKLETIVEGYDGYTDSYYGRTVMDAIDIDTTIYFTSDRELKDGDIVKVEIINAIDGELTGEAL